MGNANSFLRVYSAGGGNSIAELLEHKFFDEYRKYRVFHLLCVNCGRKQNVIGATFLFVWCVALLAFTCDARSQNALFPHCLVSRNCTFLRRIRLERTAEKWRTIECRKENDSPSSPREGGRAGGEQNRATDSAVRRGLRRCCSDCFSSMNWSKRKYSESNRTERDMSKKQIRNPSTPKLVKNNNLIYFYLHQKIRRILTIQGNLWWISLQCQSSGWPTVTLLINKRYATHTSKKYYVMRARDIGIRINFAWLPADVNDCGRY